MRSLKTVGAAVVTVLGVVAVVAVVAVGWGPGEVERRENPAPKTEARISDRGRRLHARLAVADLHADSLLWKRDLLERGSRGHVDVPRLIEGNVAVQAFTVVTSVPWGLNVVRNEDTSDMLLPLFVLQLRRVAAWRGRQARALDQAGRFRAMVEESDGRLGWIRNREDLVVHLERRRSRRAITAGMLGLEGAQALEGRAENVGRLFDAGFRMMAPAHFTDTAMGGSAAGAEKGGLTAEGRRMVVEMERRRMIVDLAHASARTIDDVLAVATRPVLVSHTGVKATCNTERNLTDAQLRSIAAKGGVIGIGFFPEAVCGRDAGAVVRAMRHAKEVLGVEHVALGSDFDGAVTVPFDASRLAALTTGLLDGGFTEAEIEAVMGGNTLRFLGEWLP